MIQCPVCKEFFNPLLLSEVVEHQHNGYSLDKEYYGVEVKEEQMGKKLNLKKKCPDCNITYPTELIQPMFIDGGYHDKCPICALLKLNEFAGRPRHAPFQGEMAENLFTQTMEYLQKNKIKHPKW